MSESPTRERREIRTSDGATLIAESIGNPAAPSLLLIGGATWSMDWWDDNLCDLLAEQGLQVLRYDQRDTGGSTSYPPGQPPYGSDDMAADALAVLDGYDVPSAHVLGFSMGGGTAQRIAAQHPERVRTLTLVSTSPATDVGRELPAPTEEIMATFTDEAEPPDWNDRDAVISWIVEGERPYAGPGHFDEAALRCLVGRVYDRTHSMEAATTNHFVVAAKDAPAVDLAAVSVPTRVLHGSHDPLFPPGHGQVLAEVLHGGDVIVLENTGHQLPPPDTWPVLANALRNHTRRAR